MLDLKRITGALARRERGRQEMRGAILDAAGRIVAADGVEGLTIRAVAQAVGYSPGALYEYFDSKEAILTSLYFDGADGLGAQCERAVVGLSSTRNSIEALGALGHAYRTYALDHAELYRLVFGGFRSPPAPDIACPGDQRGGFGTLVRLATRGVEEGALVDLAPEIIATAAWSAVHGFVSLEIAGQITGADNPGDPPPADARERRDRLFDEVLRMVMHGFLTEEFRTRRTTS